MELQIEYVGKAVVPVLALSDAGVVLVGGVRRCKANCCLVDVNASHTLVVDRKINFTD